MKRIKKKELVYLVMILFSPDFKALHIDEEIMSNFHEEAPILHEISCHVVLGRDLSVPKLSHSKRQVFYRRDVKVWKPDAFIRTALIE